MKCKKHLTADLTSTIGVCATCLRERLLSLLAAQSDRRDSDPYNGRWKSHRLSDPKLRTESATHQTDRDCDGDVSSQKNKKKKGRFSLFTSFFKPKSQKETHIDFPIPKPGDTIASTSSSCSSPFWLATKLSRHKDKQSRLFTVEEPIHQCRFRRDRGMSPARVSDVDDDDDISNPNVLIHKTPESSKQTPSRASRRGGGVGQSCHSSTNVSGFSFCLSPLVRASPSRARNQKGVLPEVSFSGGDTRSCGKPPLSMATKYCANRSRKIADFGRLNHNH